MATCGGGAVKRDGMYGKIVNCCSRTLHIGHSRGALVGITIRISRNGRLVCDSERTTGLC